MKAMLIPFVILTLVVAVTLFGFFVFNTIYGKGFEKNIGEIKKIDVTENVIGAFKAYSLLSLIYSSQEAFRESACNGGIISDQPWVWVCGAPNIPQVEEIKHCAEKFSKYFLNIYLGNFSVDLPLKVYKKGVDKCTVEVNENEVWKGKYDEGDFWVKCGNITISGIGKNISAFEKFNVSYFLINNRFWYLYRKIAEWARETDYVNCICSATMSCYTCKQAEICPIKALRELREKFKNDENVECKWEKYSSCCTRETGVCCAPTGCIPWHKKCLITCRPQCSKETKDLLGSCIPQNLRVFKSAVFKSNDINGRGNYNYNAVYFSSCGCDERECRLERRDVFVCIDHKYYVPSASGPVPLKFTIIAEAGFRACS